MSKRPGIITISPMESETCPHLKFSVDFDGHNEGSGFPLEDRQAVENAIVNLIKRHSKKYDIQIIDERIKQNVLFQ